MPTLKKKRLGWAALVSAVLCLPGICLGDGYAAGTETTFKWEGLGDPLRVFVPENYDAAVAAPVIFYYHGTTGRPNFGCLLEVTGRRDFVIVGMTYPTPGRLDGSEDGLKAGLDRMFMVRDFLGEKLNLDERRVYVAGFSKGGWFASMSSEFGLGRVRGALILGAGKTARAPDLRPEIAKKRPAGSYPIYVGIGQWDGNYVSSVRSIRHFSEIGGRVTFDSYPGLAHDMDEGSEYLKQWLAVEAAGRGEDVVGRKAGGWWMKTRSELARLEGLDRYLLLKHVERAPYHRLLSEEARGEIAEMMEVVRGEASLAGEFALEQRMLAILSGELADGTLPNVMVSMRRYRELAEEAPEAHFGKEAFVQWMRCHSVMEQTLAYPLAGLEDRPEFAGLEDKVRAQKPDEGRVGEVLEYFSKMGGEGFWGKRRKR